MLLIAVVQIRGDYICVLSHSDVNILYLDTYDNVCATCTCCCCRIRLIISHF
ncbi:hypothetical protein EVA_21379 [gut metagenome]|uniref:Uncharacterized protein n=1 Tax=gut metagenome TaxID=749906 RepID=J9BSG4_9ZZZZ